MWVSPHNISFVDKNSLLIKRIKLENPSFNLVQMAGNLLCYIFDSDIKGQH
jgi:hypothetical protein